MRALVIAVVAAILAAGCSGGGSGGPSSSSSSSASGPSGSTTTPHAHPGASSTAPTSTGGPTSDPSPGAGHAPAANLTVTPGTGGAPLAVTFLVNGTDVDGEALRFNLTFGDGAPAAVGELTGPLSIAHTYAAAGTYEAKLNVTDAFSFGLDTLTILVTEGAAGGPVQVEDGTFLVGVEGCAAAGYDAAGADPGAPAGGTTNEVTRFQFNVDARTMGRPYTAAFTFDEGYLYVSVDYYDAGGSLLQSDNTGQSPNFGGIVITGTVPTGAAKAVLFACAGPTEASVHYEA